jgi:DNA (cytosine-5)-methyltransferase 1
MIYLDGFSGYGGFHLGLELAGFNFTECYFSEVDKYAIANYKYNFPKSKYAGSIKDISGGTLPGLDVFTFGWPCQDNSVAGKRKGQSAGTRSGLLYEAVRIIDIYKPWLFIAENVKGLLSVNGGIDFFEALKVLAYLNSELPQYDIEMQLLNTRWLLPQNRERLYFVGHLRERGSRKILPIGQDDLIRNGSTANSEEIHDVAQTMTARQYASWNGNFVAIPFSFNINPSGRGMNGPVHSSEGISPSLTTNKGEGIKIVSNTKAGYEEAQPGDSINLSVPNSETRRVRVGKQVSQTLDTTCNMGVIAQPTANNLQWVDSKNGYNQSNRAYYEESQAGALLGRGDRKVIDGRYIRKLTPVECERLQGLPDGHTKYGVFTDRPKRSDLLFREQNPELWAYHTKMISADNVALREISDGQRYRLCGNGVSIPIVTTLGRKYKLLNPQFFS